jgi:hypothetical protein
LQDPKQTLINLLTSNLSVTKDDGTTKANVLVTSAWYTDMMMNNFDALVTVGMLTDPVTPSGFGFATEDHTYIADVNVWTENKYDSSGTRIITDEIIRYKIVQAIDQTLASNHATLAGIHRAKISRYMDLDDPTRTGGPNQVPYPLRRANLEIELFIPTISSLAA